jgi:beta-glucosidase
MKLTFPPHFLWGTSTASAQIETPTDHNWRGVKSKDGYTFDRTTDHELRQDEDIELICALGEVYRCGVDWAWLQKGPTEPFNRAAVVHYKGFFEDLVARDVKIMFVFHHFTNPNWFEAMGGFENKANIAYYLDYMEQCVTHFGEFAYAFNTFNEPNVYAVNGFVMGQFPPFKKSPMLGDRVARNMGAAHDVAYDYLKKIYPNKMVGISLNTVTFRGENLLGKLPAAFADWWFNNRVADMFKKCDFWGLSYYALIPLFPFPVTEIDQPGELAKRGYKHDGMWAYYPEGLGRVLQHFHKKYRKPIWITENGICSNDPQQRIESIKDYLKVIHDEMQKGVEVIGYTHWSTFDNFEWNLGPTFRFGLVTVDLDTKDRTMTAAGEFFGEIARTGSVEI